ncbi:unnamed protein product [Kluyveromyces dobzhanskii CBS 2104]|uniref:WGS project CCBQ000000000 data, contig 00016 n=1 Tax=Kluyveromyces dobzhanskii CBS 2104 TaxID=1427455 RepID=A0A0A8KZX8_9SACH|nr:unnamed protein product [Kluyveromyces dobzhanskii CBS 2104]
MSFPYESEVQTEIPPLQKETFNDATFTYLKWPSNLKRQVSDGNTAESNEPAEVITKCRVLIVHGFCEYHKVYYKLMDRLSLNGVESFMFDQRGAGDTSPGKEKGNTDEASTFADLDHFLQMNLSECEPLGRKLYLFGHSMGGGIILNYGCNGKYKDKIAGFITTGPLIELHPSTRPNFILRGLAPFLAAVLPRHKIDTGLNVNGITSSAKYREVLKTDPKLKVIGSFRQIHDMMERGKRLVQVADYANSLDKPVLIMHGEADTINDPKSSELFINNRLPQLEDKTLKLYRDAKHSLLSVEVDSVFDEAFKDMMAWIDAHAA